jgi:hypothetical protein
MQFIALYKLDKCFTLITVSQEEKKLFYARLAEAGANGQWGIFSMKIPGRVGYQVI